MNISLKDFEDYSVKFQILRFPTIEIEAVVNFYCNKITYFVTRTNDMSEHHDYIIQETETLAEALRICDEL